MTQPISAVLVVSMGIMLSAQAPRPAFEVASIKKLDRPVSGFGFGFRARCACGDRATGYGDSWRRAHSTERIHGHHCSHLHVDAPNDVEVILLVDDAVEVALA